MIDIKYANAFSEILEIVFNLTEQEYKKIPKKFLQFIEENSNPEYEFNYDSSKTLEEQNVLPETKIIIAIICRDFLVDKEEKERIIQKEKKELIDFEMQQREKYNPDKLFKNKYDNENVYQNKIKETALVEYKEKFFTKFKHFIMKLLHVKN